MVWRLYWEQERHHLSQWTMFVTMASDIHSSLEPMQNQKTNLPETFCSFGKICCFVKVLQDFMKFLVHLLEVSQKEHLQSQEWCILW